MKQKWLLGVLALPLLVGNAIPTLAANNKMDRIFDSDKIIQNYFDLENKSITDYLPFESVYAVYEKQCSKQSIWSAKMMIHEIMPLWEEDIPVWKYPMVMAKRFLLAGKMLSHNDNTSVQKFCQQKYYYYRVMEAAQTSYIKFISPDYVRWSPINYDYKNLIQINNDVKDLNGEQKLLANQAKSYIQDEIWNLLDLGLLDLNDLEMLDGKIYINYALSCENTKGSFHLAKDYNYGDKELESINLNISLCGNDDFQENYKNYVRQIFIHEIGHYIDVFKDKEKSDFYEICWEDASKTCSNNAFVSKYAQNSAAEDYAESFAYWYLDNFNGVDKELGSASTEKLGEKMIYFGDLVNHI